MGIKAGDQVVLRDNDMNSFTVTVSALCENFVYNYIYMNKETYAEQTGALPEYKSAYAVVKRIWTSMKLRLPSPTGTMCLLFPLLQICGSELQP